MKFNMNAFLALLALTATFPCCAEAGSNHGIRSVADRGQHGVLRGLGSRIIGGTPATEGEYPSFGTSDEANGTCGGSLVAPDVALTAAHCEEAFPVGSMWQQGGITRGGGETFVIQEVLRHPAFDANTLANDVVRAVLVCLKRVLCFMNASQMFPFPSSDAVEARPP